MRTLAVPARCNADDAEVLRGKFLFNQSGCASCHTPKLRTKTDVSFKEISGANDLPLHQHASSRYMGEDLADHRPDYEASRKLNGELLHFGVLA